MHVCINVYQFSVVECVIFLFWLLALVCQRHYDETMCCQKIHLRLWCSTNVFSLLYWRWKFDLIGGTVFAPHMHRLHDCASIHSSDNNWWPVHRNIMLGSLTIGLCVCVCKRGLQCFCLFNFPFGCISTCFKRMEHINVHIIGWMNFGSY